MFSVHLKNVPINSNTSFMLLVCFLHAGVSMLISAGCTFFLFLSYSQAAIIALQCLFCGVSVAAWNGIEVITVELYPASKRCFLWTHLHSGIWQTPLSLIIRGKKTNDMLYHRLYTKNF